MPYKEPDNKNVLYIITRVAVKRLTRHKAHFAFIRQTPLIGLALSLYDTLHFIIYTAAPMKTGSPEVVVLQGPVHGSHTCLS